MDIEESLKRLRSNYERATLDESSAARDPLEQFTLWLEEALATGSIVEPNAMTIASVSGDRRPSARIVLLRGYDERGFVFYTNYESRKGRELQARPYAALLFYWGELQRQIRIEGPIAQIAPAESDAYFARRPRGHRLSAWASQQSAPIASRATLEAQMHDVEQRFAGVDVPRPPYWGGYRVAPEAFEFWQGRPDRVHDRLAYVRNEADGGWRIERLSP